LPRVHIRMFHFNTQQIVFLYSLSSFAFVSFYLSCCFLYQPLCPVYDSSTNVSLFIGKHIFIKSFWKISQTQWKSSLHNPFKIIYYVLCILPKLISCQTLKNKVFFSKILRKLSLKYVKILLNGSNNASVTYVYLNDIKSFTELNA
jgi:hypothetical protein